MRLHFLGTGGYHPTDLRETSCVMVPERGIILDAGSSFYRVAPLLETRELDIYLTHAHLDHICGLTFFLVPMLSGQVDAVRVHGSEQTLSAVRTHLFAEPIFPVLPDFEFLPLQTVTPLPGGGELRTISQDHPGGSLGFRLDFADRSLGYLTDVHQTGSAREFIRGVDLLIHECNFGDGQEDWAARTGHSTPMPVAKMASEAGVRRVIFTHFDPTLTDDPPIDLTAARSVLESLEPAVDGMVVEF